jgi:RHS repeat-associated protein
VQTEYTYGAFGAITTSGGSTTNRSAFTGREDDETGLNYYRARYQHPTFQRFAAEDPIQFEGGTTNLHQYASNAPTNWRDPLGLFSMLPPPACNPKKHPNAWLLKCNPLVIGAGPVFAAAAAAGMASASASGTGGAAASGTGGAPTFGHGARHLAGTGLSRAAVEAAIAEAIRQIQKSSNVVGEFWGKVVVSGESVIYRAYPTSGGPINVGTYYPGK